MATSLTLSRLRIARLLWAASLLIVSLGLFREVYVAAFGFETPLRDLRHIALNAEYCLPAWYSSLALASCSLLLYLISIAERARGSRRWIGRWRALSAIFLYLSADEAVGIHEVTMRPLARVYHFTGPLHFSWVIVAIPAVLMLSIYFAGFLRDLPRRIGFLFLASGIMFVGGALGMELLGGVVLEAFGEASLPYVISFSIEESLEIFGATLFALTLLEHLGSFRGGASVVFMA